MTGYSLGVWNSNRGVSEDEAASIYLRLSDEGLQQPFDAEVYAFYRRLTDHYPEVELVPEDELDSCPWASSIELGEGHVILPILPDMLEEVVPLVLSLAEYYGLVCFDPQSWKVHRPTRLKVQQGEVAFNGHEGIIAAIEQHFRNAMVDVRNRVDALLTNVAKPRVISRSSAFLAPQNRE